MSGGLPSTPCEFWSVVSAVLIGLSMSTATLAKSPDAPDSSPEEPKNALKSGYRLQEFDDIALPFKPRNAVTAAEKVHSEAVAWFMTGRLLETRNEPRKAMNAYRKALALDPRAIEVYRQLAPLEYDLKEVDSAIQTATKAVEIDPDDHVLLQLLAAQAAKTGRLPDAVRYLEQAVKSPRVSKKTFEYVLLNINLGVLFSEMGQAAQAADCYEIIFDALVKPEKYQLDFRTKSRILSAPETSYERIGQIFLDAKRIPLAVQAYELAAKTGRTGPANVSYNRAKVLLLSEKPEEALAELQKYFDAQRRSKGRDAYQLLVDILVKLNRSDEVIARLEEMAAKDLHNLPLQFFLGERLYLANDLDKARQIYEAALPHGADLVGYIGLMRVLRKMKKTTELLDLLDRTLNKLGADGLAQMESELKSGSEEAETLESLIATGREQLKSDTRQMTFRKAYILGNLAKSLSRVDDAIEFFLTAIKLEKRQSIELYVEIAIMLERAHRHETLEEVLAKVLMESHPTGERAFLLMFYARSLVHNGKFTESIESINEALRLAPNNPRLLYNEAFIYVYARKWDEAIVKYETLRDMPTIDKGTQRECQFMLSNIYVQKGEFVRGEQILEAILETDPDSTQVNNDLGYLWADQGKNLEQAEKMIRKAVEAEPDNGAYLDSLGWVLFKRGKYQEAIGPIEEAVKKNTGGDATLWDHLGDVQLKLMQIDKATQSWQKALKSASAERFSDGALVERLKEKLKQYASDSGQPKPAIPGSP